MLIIGRMDMHLFRNKALQDMLAISEIRKDKSPNSGIIKSHKLINSSLTPYTRLLYPYFSNCL